MKKPIKNITDPTSNTFSKLETLSDNISNAINDSTDEFVLFPLDVQETKSEITNLSNENSSATQDDYFILFPLDVKDASSNTNNSASITNQKNNKSKKQFVTKPSSQLPVNPKPNRQKKQFVTKPSPQTPINPQPPTKPILFSPKNNKLRNLFWLIVICFSIYTFINKKSNESYRHFFSKTRHKIGYLFNNLKSNLIDEGDFKEFKKGKKIIYSPFLEYVEDESGKLQELRGDSIIIIEPTGKSHRSYYLPKGKPFKLKISNDEFTESERFANEKMELDIDQNSFENSSEYVDRVSVFLLNSGFFSQEISVHKHDIRFENSNDIEVKYMRNRIEDFKKNTILTKFISKSLLNPKEVVLNETASNIMIGTFIKYEWIENDMFTFKDEKGNEIYFTGVPENCVIFNENGVNKNYYNKKFKIKWVVDDQSYEYPINNITQIELIK